MEVLTAVRTIRETRRLVANRAAREASSGALSPQSPVLQGCQSEFDVERRLRTSSSSFRDQKGGSRLLEEEKASLDACPMPRGFEVIADHLLRWIVSVPGLSGTVHDGAMYRFVLEFENDYPLRPPVVTITNTHHFHPNISPCAALMFKPSGSERLHAHSRAHEPTFFVFAGVVRFFLVGSAQRRSGLVSAGRES